jgi:hypothetical protein
MKTEIRISGIIALFLIVSLAVSIFPDDFFVSTLFSVSGVMFSVGLGLIVTFNARGIKNKTYIKQIRRNVVKVRNSFIIYFAISIVCFVAEKYLRDNNLSCLVISIKNFQVNLNWSLLLCLFMLYSISYYIVNFLKIQALNNDIFDKTNDTE